MATNLNDEEQVIYWAMKSYIKALYEAKAVDENKMKRYYYEPIEKLVEVWKLK